MVDYERIRKLELFFGCMVPVPVFLYLGLHLLWPPDVPASTTELKPHDVAAQIILIGILFFMPPLSITLGAYLHSVHRNIAGLILILFVGTLLIFATMYLSLFALYGFRFEAKHIIAAILWLLTPGLTLLTIFFAGVFGDPANHA